MNKSEELKKLGKRIQRLRRAKKLSQEDLAYSINKDRSSIARVETGAINPTYIYLLEVCEGLECEMKDIL